MNLTAYAADSTWSMRDARRAFAALSVPDPAELAGGWDGRFVGRPRLRRLTAGIAALTPLRGWCGKRILRSGDVVNLVVRRGTRRDSIRAVAAPGKSLVDGRPAVVVDYSSAPPPARWVRGELRWLTPQRELLGLLMFQVGGRRFGSFPFVMTATDSDCSPEASPATGRQSR